MNDLLYITTHDLEEITQWAYWSHLKAQTYDDADMFLANPKFYICKKCKIYIRKFNNYNYNFNFSGKYFKFENLTCDEIIIKNIIE